MPDDLARLRPALAPLWHTASLVALIVAVAVTGTVISRDVGAATRTPMTPEIALGFAQLVAVQLSLLAYVCRVGRGRWVLGQLVAVRWRDRSRAVVDLAFAALIVGCVIGLETAWASLLPTRTDGAISSFLPHTPAQVVAWSLVACVVGFSEEVVYRGYLQQQLGARTGSRLLGLVLAAVLFGVAHLEQGWLAAARIGVYGLVFGVVARRRGSLVPGIVAHVAIDVLAGIAPLR